ncbi:hypothetical protein PVAND_014387 [Polypedilum vanderplanki]|uniref:VWFA domain-containing protein n=1 Tax=Polypedilum vanderplanki TaxID=319348 RepID=A0A9J6B908_POLVA|nr:hypothetical protein PVAND_014387 [Polypedilum vanderplanki]
MSNSIKFVCLMLCIGLTRSIIVRNGVYENFVIEIQKDVSDDDCNKFLLTLEKILSSSSQYLHSTLDNRILFNSIDIILPPAWSNNCVTNTTVTSYNGASTDAQIITTHSIFGDDLWTKQASSCGEHGEQIYMSERSIRESYENVEKKFVTEFMKYRYGVFDTNGFDSDPIYPKCSASNNPICNDAMSLESSASYNRYMPTKQNQLCNRMSRMDVVMGNSDFNSSFNGQRTVEYMPPTFNYVRKMSTRYMVVVDDHADISIRDSYSFLRDAIRKWLDKDLTHHGTEVGITKISSNEGSTIRTITSSHDSDELFAKLPFIVSNRAGLGKCNIESSIDRSIELMRDRVKVHGDAISAIILIAPGMYNCSQEVLDGIINRANAAYIKIVTINYPKIGTNRVPLDELAIRTGGQAFTVVERKSNEDRSLLSTFFELTSVFMQISAAYHHGDQADLPIEIYRKELHDANISGDSTKARTYTDSFNVDDATRNIHFYLYFYDRKDIGMFIDGMSLTSPNQQTFTAYTELRSDYHQLTFVSNLSGAGSWHYNVKRFNGPQPHFVQVLAYPKIDTTSFIKARAWIHKPNNGGPNKIYVEVMQGNLPIVDALVEINVKLPNGREEKMQLFDSGSGDPDVTRGDGIYSRYFMAEDIGMHQFAIKISDNGNTAYIQIDRDPLKQIHCCGSAIITPSKQPVTPFTRHIAPLTIFITQDDLDNAREKLSSIGRIGDLHVTATNGSEKVILEWTGPDTGLENSKAEFEIRYALSLKDIVDSFDNIAMPWPLAETIPHSIGQGASVTLNLLNEPTLIGVPFYVAIRSANTISNYARIFVPKRKPTASPTYTHIDNDIYETDPSMEPADEDDGIFKHHNLASIPWSIIIPIIVCCLFILLAFIIYFCCCRRNYKQPTKSPAKPAISVITPSTPVQQNQYHVEPGYLVDVPDHHTVGLPMIDDELMKPDFTDHDKMLIEEMKQQQRFQQAFDQQQQIITSTLTRNGQYLSPYESWSASTLLNEHEVRQSPLDMYVDANGDIVPQIPPHPYHQQQNTAYGYVDPNRAPPPQYSSVYRPLVRGVPGQGSMQSVVSSAMMSNSDGKKIRNVTMV